MGDDFEIAPPTPATIFFRDRSHTIDEIRQFARDRDLGAIAELGMRRISLTFPSVEEAAAWTEWMSTQFVSLPLNLVPTASVAPSDQWLPLRRRAGDQELPTIDPNGICVQDEVIAYIERRKAVGIERYGTVLQPHNGRDALRDAFEEACDLTQYLAQALIERDGALP